jgi:signal transduction histidine kinase
MTTLAPQSLFARVMIIMVVGLAIAQSLTFAFIRYERSAATREMMMTNIERDIASSIAIIDRLPPAERPSWFPRLERRNYRFEFGSDVQGTPVTGPFMQAFATAIATALRPFEVVRTVQVENPDDGVDLLVRLNDRSTVVIHAYRVALPISDWVPWVLALQLAVLAACGWIAVRVVTRPLAQLASAADRLGPELKGETLDATGPLEVAHAARAFNAMQARIAGYMKERVEILAAISHDLQTPITRLRLRTDLMEDNEDRAKFRQDLDVMSALVREGVAYARTLHGAAEPPVRVDADALFESIVSDYQDAGQPVRLEGRVGAPIVTRPNALRRIVANLIDNALKYGGGTVQLHVQAEGRRVALAVADDGPGIPEDQLEAVLKPFYRLESSRNRGTGGTGLGLAIAHQLAMAMGASLVLRNRAEGGLEARVELTALPDAAA